VGSSDNGGVHINSGIANKTFYLLAAGGAHHRGGSMTGIGADKAAAIWYTALTSYMTSSAGFARAARATYEGAVGLYGAGRAEAGAVEDAWALTGLTVAVTPPTIALTSPADGATVIAPISVIATAADDVAVTAVEVYVDGALIGTDTTSPFAV